MIVLGLVIGCILMYFVLRPKLTTIQEYDRRIEEQNKQLLEEHDNLNSDVARVKADLNYKNNELNAIN